MFKPTLLFKPGRRSKSCLALFKTKSILIESRLSPQGVSQDSQDENREQLRLRIYFGTFRMRVRFDVLSGYFIASEVTSRRMYFLIVSFITDRFSAWTIIFQELF